MEGWKEVAIGLPVFLVAITLHEVAHGWVADRLGDSTAREQGRLTLNPLAHLDVLGTLFFLLSSLTGWGFGWAKPVPVNMARLGPYPFQKMVLVALAGPFANLLQAAAWYGLFLLALTSWLLPRPVLEGAALLGLYGIIVNLLLALFNLLPIPPLDGSRVVGGLLPTEWAVRWYQWSGLGFLVLLFFLRSPLYPLLVLQPVEALLRALLP